MAYDAAGLSYFFCLSGGLADWLFVRLLFRLLRFGFFSGTGS